MTQIPIFAPISVKEWLALAEREKIKHIKTEMYSMAYGILRSHFEKLESVTWDDAVLGLHVVYGWMPTIPKLNRIMQLNKEKKERVAQVLTRAIRGEVPKDSDLKVLQFFCNNSMVGASKLLHFLNPALFPIWDSRVAKVFLNRANISSSQVNNTQTWKCYQETLMNWLQNDAVQKKCNKLRKLAGHLQNVTDLRLVELVLFISCDKKEKT